MDEYVFNESVIHITSDDLVLGITEPIGDGPIDKPSFSMLIPDLVNKPLVFSESALAMIVDFLIRRGKELNGDSEI